MSTIRFEATILEPEARANGGSTRLDSEVNPRQALVLRLSKSVRAKLPAQDTTMVEGVVNHFPFRAALSPEGLSISDGIRTGARSEVGDTVKVELTRIGNEPETRVPTDLAKAINASAKAKAEWDDTTPMSRRDWVLSILAVRQLETRRGRIVKTIDMLAHGKGRICCFPGINWLTRDYVSKDETWLPLPKRQVPSKKREE